MTRATDPSDKLVARHLRAAAEALPPVDPADDEGQRLRMDLARCLLAAGDAEAARTLTESAGGAADLDTLDLRIKAALEAGDSDAALRTLDAARALFEEEVRYLRKKLVLLRGANRVEDTLPVLEALHRARPANPAFLIEIGQAQLALDRPEAAGQAFDKALEIAPQSAAAWTGRLDVAQAGADREAVGRIAEAAFAALPDNPTLTLRSAQLLRRSGRTEAARDRLETWLKTHRDPPAGMGLALAQIQADLGHHAAAEALYADLQARHPGQPNVWAGHIRMLLDAGDIDRALELGGAALAHCPEAMPLLRLRAEVLRWAGRHDEAIAVLEALHARRPDDTEITLTLAAAHRQAGQAEAAGALFGAVLARDPENWPALQGHVALAEARGDFEAALRLLAGADGPLPPPPEDAAGLPLETLARTPMRLLRLAELGFRAGRNALAQAALARLARLLPVLNDAQLVRFMTLADRQRALDLLAQAIGHVPERAEIGAALAVAVLRRAHSAEDEALAGEIEALLADRVPPAERPAYEVQAARLRRGPEAAFQALRAQRVAERTPGEARVLAGALIASGRSLLALRYLRFCDRRWPNAGGIRGTLLSAYLLSGRAEEARGWVAGLDSDGGTGTVEAMQAKVAVETGRLAEAREIMLRQVAGGRLRPGDETLLLTQIGLGLLDEALATAEAIRADLEQSPKYAAHFGSGLNGQILNELLLYRRIRPDAAETGPERSDAATYYVAAKQVVDDWLAAPPPPKADAPSAPPVPRRIFQYWNGDSVPAAVSQVMQSWRGRPGWDYRLLSRRAAIDWLRTTYGARHARAFTMARGAAEESDFLRLCLLAEEGGIYADADDKLVGRPEDLPAQGPGLVLFREPFGAIPNNLICAPAGHPVMTGAANMVCAALLRRDNDNTWLKSGPGLLTRALALHILDDPAAAAADTTVVPLYRMRRAVHPHTALPYKSTRKYWDPRSGSLEPEIHAVLRDLVRGTPAP